MEGDGLWEGGTMSGTCSWWRRRAAKRKSPAIQVIVLFFNT